MTKTVRLTTLVVALALAGCASVSVERNVEATQSFSREKFAADMRWLNSDEQRQTAQVDVARLLDKPLSGEDAVRIAVAYSAGFQALLADNAAASAQATQRARLPNPVFTFEKLVRTEDRIRDLDIGRKLAFSVLDLVFLPARINLAEAQQQRLRMKAAGQVVQTVTEARQAWVQAVAAQQSLTYSRQVMQAAKAGAELARRMQAAGNFSRLQRAREQAFYAEAAAQLTRSQQIALNAREGLVRVLGLDPTRAAALTLPERLPDLPAQPRTEPDVTRHALEERIDIRQARFELEELARARGLTRVESIVDGLQIAARSNSASGRAPQRGYEIEFPLPLFDFGDASRSAAQAQYMAAFHRAAQTAVDASSQVRQQYGAYRTAYDLARHYRDEIVPLRKSISDEMLLKYNGMLEGVFELLADSRQQIGSVIAAIDAQRDYWLADAALQATLLGKPMGMPEVVAGVASGASD